MAAMHRKENYIHVVHDGHPASNKVWVLCNRCCAISQVLTLVHELHVFVGIAVAVHSAAGRQLWHSWDYDQQHAEDAETQLHMLASVYDDSDG